MNPYALGAIPSTLDERDHEIARYAIVALPPSYLPLADWTNLNQGSVPACVGYSGALDTQVGTELVDTDMAVFDGLDLYQHCKAIDGYNGDGTSIRVAIKVRQDTGALVAKAISGSLQVGAREKITNYARLNNVTDIKTAIVAYGSAWMASNWYNSWFNPKADGTLPPAGGGIAGGHAFEFVGYDDARQAFLMQNSWGTSWGLTGRCWFPYSYLTSAIGWEAWRTIAAPLEGTMRYSDPLDSPIGTLVVANDTGARAVPIDGGAAWIAGIAGKTYPVYGHEKLRVPINATPNSAEFYRVWVNGVECVILARNCTFTPNAPTPTVTIGTATVTVGSPNATVEWK